MQFGYLSISNFAYYANTAAVETVSWFLQH